MVECKIVALKVVGSNPIVYLNSGNGAVGSVSVLGTDGHVFKSHFLVWVSSSVGRAMDF
jgi:hypothetical protein